MVRACSTSRLRSGLFSYLQIPAVRVVLKDTNDRFPATTALSKARELGSPTNIEESVRPPKATVV